MAAADSRPETAPDGTLLLDQPVTLPETLDLLIAGGGPFGTAAAFRAKELGLKALVIDYDDLMKRIRDYPKDKLILPDFGGGDSMEFPQGGELIQKLQFGPIDRDEMCARWKGLYRTCGVPAQIGVEMTGLARDGEAWRVQAWNNKTKAEQFFRARHVVLAFGRGEPRRLDVPGAEGLAFGLSDAGAYVDEPVCVIGGGTSAAEAVIAISNAKAAKSDPSEVYWSYHGDKMPQVSKALADVFFEAFVGRGNIRYLPKSEPVAVISVEGEPYLSLRTSRVAAAGAPAETRQLEFRKRCCIACIGADIPAALLEKIGTPLVTGGPSNKKRIVLSPLLETRQPNVYLAGDVISPIYLETQDFNADPAGLPEIKRRGNIKAALRDGVVVAEVIKKKLDGAVVIAVNPFSADRAREQAPPRTPNEAVAPPVTPPGVAPCTLVAMLPSNLEGGEYRLKAGGVTTLGRQGADVSFPDDAALSDIHAEVVAEAGGYLLRSKGSTQAVFLQPHAGRVVEVEPGTIVRVGRQWLVTGGLRNPAVLAHYSPDGQRLGTYPLKPGANVVGRKAPDTAVAPDVAITPDDDSLSRRHFEVSVKDGRVALRDLGSQNGTLIKIATPFRLSDGDRILLGSQVLRFDDERVKPQPPKSVVFDTSYRRRPSPPPIAPTPSPAPSPGVPLPGPAPSAGEPAIVFSGDGKQLACTKDQSICEAAEKAGITIRASCHRGLCGEDLIRVVSGAEHLNKVGDTEQETLDSLPLEPGPYRLACMARVSGPVTVEIVKRRA